MVSVHKQSIPISSQIEYIRKKKENFNNDRLSKYDKYIAFSLINTRNKNTTFCDYLNFQKLGTVDGGTQRKTCTGIYRSEQLRIREHNKKDTLKLTLIAEFAPVSWIALALTGHTVAVTVTPIHAAF